MVLNRDKLRPTFVGLLAAISLVILSNCTNPIVEAVMDIRNSAKASLSAIALSSGTLIPAFNPDILDYSVGVDQSLNSITISATRVDAGATISFNPSQIVVLNEGSNTVTATVTPEGGISKTYTVTVTRTPSPTIVVTGTGITRTVTITKPATCPSSTVYYTTNGMDISMPENRIAYTVPLNVAGNGVSIQIKAVAIVNGVSSSIGTETTSRISYANLGLTQAPENTSLTNVYAATAINKVIYYSSDQSSIRKSEEPYSSSTVIAGGVVGTDLDGIGSDARFTGITDITTDGINLYVLTSTKVRKINLTTYEVTTIAALNSLFSGGKLSAVTDGTYVIFQNFVNMSSNMARVRIFDGDYTYINSAYIGLPTQFFSGLASNGVNLFSTIMEDNAKSGYFAFYDNASPWTPTISPALSYRGTRGIAVTASDIYMAHYYDSGYSTIGPITRTTGGTTVNIATTSSNFCRKLFTDGIWLYGYGNSVSTNYYGTLYIIK